jgi:hypothetical protein
MYYGSPIGTLAREGGIGVETVILSKARPAAHEPAQHRRGPVQAGPRYLVRARYGTKRHAPHNPSGKTIKYKILFYA